MQAEAKLKALGIDVPKVNAQKSLLSLAGKKRISPQLLEVIESHKGDKVDVYTNDGISFGFDARVLLVVK